MVAAWRDHKTADTASITSTTAPRVNLDQIADEIVANVQKRKHTRYLNPWERVQYRNEKFPKFPRMDWDKGHIKGNWLLGNFYGRDSDYFGSYPRYFMDPLRHAVRARLRREDAPFRWNDQAAASQHYHSRH